MLLAKHSASKREKRAIDVLVLLIGFACIGMRGHWRKTICPKPNCPATPCYDRLQPSVDVRATKSVIPCNPGLSGARLLEFGVNP